MAERDGLPGIEPRLTCVPEKLSQEAGSGSCARDRPGPMRTKNQPRRTESQAHNSCRTAFTYVAPLRVRFPRTARLPARSRTKPRSIVRRFRSRWIMARGS